MYLYYDADMTLIAKIVKTLLKTANLYLQGYEVNTYLLHLVLISKEYTQIAYCSEKPNYFQALTLFKICVRASEFEIPNSTEG